MTVAPRHRGPFWEEEVLGDILRSIDSRLFQEELRSNMGRHGDMSVITVPDAGSLPPCPPLGQFAVDVSTGDIYVSVVDPDGIPCDTMWVPTDELPPWPGGGGETGSWPTYFTDLPPSSAGDNGESWYDPSTNTLYILEDGVWTAISGGGGGGPDLTGFTFVRDTRPTPTVQGETWWNSAAGADSGSSWVAIDEGSGQLVWVQFAPGAAATEDPVVSFTFNQGVTASVWNITHNLGWYPNVTVIDSGGSTVEGELVHLSANALRLTFSGAFTGTAFLS